MTWFVFPAQAGVILSGDMSCNPQVGIPRASGGDPQIQMIAKKRMKYSPRKRG